MNIIRRRITSKCMMGFLTLMRLYFIAAHDAIENAGAARLAALIQTRASLRRRKIGLPLCGGNVNHRLFARVLTAPQAHRSHLRCDQVNKSMP